MYLRHVLGKFRSRFGRQASSEGHPSSHSPPSRVRDRGQLRTIFASFGNYSNCPARNQSNHPGNRYSNCPDCNHSNCPDCNHSNNPVCDHITQTMATLETLHFDNKALRELPLDPQDQNYVRTVAGACFSRVDPTPVEGACIVAYSRSAMQLLDLDGAQLERPEFAEYFAGNRLLPGSKTAAHCYCGHQFGYFAGQLGDGAAMYLGEIINAKNERWEIQLKGAGLTPYSRQADGRKVLRSSIREFLCSEAMHFLGVPTTRAGTCVTSDTKVVRDIFYDGHPIRERCTIVLRIAPTFIRFGSFEIFKTLDQTSGRPGPSVGRKDILTKLLEYTIETFYPEVKAAHPDNAVERYKAFYKEVVLRTARLVASWQCVGFCHGVLNTDNMSIVGVTIDYGPFGFMDSYDPDHICNASDDGGRYTFIRQPEICKWNLRKLAEALQSVLPLSESLPILDGYLDEFQQCYLDKMRLKLGLLQKQIPEDKELIQGFHDAMEETGGDFTNCFRRLSILKLPGTTDFEDSLSRVKEKLLEQCCTVEDLIHKKQPGANSRYFQMLLQLLQSSPELMARSGGLPAGLFSQTDRLKELQKTTPSEKLEKDSGIWTQWLEKYVDRLKAETDGVADVEELQAKRAEVMNSNNPRFVLRNYIAQNAIAAAEKGDYSEVWKVLEVLENPYENNNDPVGLLYEAKGTSTSTAATEEQDFMSQASPSTKKNHVSCLGYDSRPPEWSRDLRVT